VKKLSSGALKTITILVPFFLIEWGPLSAQPRETSGFAEHLYTSKDYYRAISEYKRESFFEENTLKKRWADYRIGESYRKSGRAEKSVPYFVNAAWFGVPDSLTDSCVLSLARSYIDMGSFETARGILDSLGKETPEKAALAGWSYLLEGDFENAGPLFSSADRGPLADLTAVGQKTRWKSPRTAAVMSAVIPGSGQIYAGGYKQGAISLLLHGLIAYVTYRAVEDHRYFEAGAALYTGFSRFYVGNILAASSLARERNRVGMAELVEKAKREHGGDLD
jgi:hypothetical protein